MSPRRLYRAKLRSAMILVERAAHLFATGRPAWAHAVMRDARADLALAESWLNMARS